jgi:hypothetical protein
MKTFVACALIALAAAFNSEAAPKDKKDKPARQDKPSVIIVDKVKDKEKGPVFSVPDTGSTALLLGTAILVLGVAGRRFATR